MSSSPRTNHSSFLNAPPEFSIFDVRRADGSYVLAIAGELDIATVPVVRERLGTLIEAGARRLVVDLRDVSFMDSTGLAAFIHAKMRLGDEGALTLVMEQDSYARLIFEVAGLVGVLEVVDTLD
ncbi:MAG TPA: STAS domain-containing protein [Solirubrobacteraceae bacterium]|nr:STAS domain-containing protein [Solirubrobacteraceae bacterium]